MMTQNVKPSVINLLSSSREGRSSSVKKQNGDSDFGSVMDTNLKAKSAAEKDDTPVEQTGGKRNSKQKLKDNPKPEENPKTADEKNDGSDLKTKNNNGNTGNSADNNVKAAGGQSDNMEDAAKDVISDYKSLIKLFIVLQNTVQKKLGLTDEQLEKAMESLGFTAADLLNPDNLKQLALLVNGKDDISEALTDENLADTIGRLVQEVDELKTRLNTGLSGKEVTEALKNLTKTAAAESQPVDPAALKAPAVSEKDLNGDSSPARTKQDDLNLEVYKLDDSVKDSKNQGNGGLAGDAKNKDADVKTASPVELLIQNLAVKGNENTLNFNEQIANVRQMQNITDQIVEQVKIMIKPDQTSMELQLNPESLGKINLSVVAKDGIMTAHFTAQNEIVKEAIESQIQVLKDNLNNQGLKVESIEVTVSNFSFEQSNQASGGDEKGQQGQSRNRNFDSGEPDIYPNADEETDQDIGLMEQSGSSIDYTA